MSFFDHNDSLEGSRRSSVTTVVHRLSSKNQKKLSKKHKKAALSVVHQQAKVSDSEALRSSSRQKRNTFANFFHIFNSEKSSERARHNATKVLKSQVSAPKQLDIDHALVERVMGKPKEADKALGDSVLQQETRARPRTGTRSASSTDELREDGGRAQRSRQRRLTTEEAQSMFLGAPYFNVGKDQSAGAYRPQVVFLDTKSSVCRPNATTDHSTLGHTSFEAISLAAESAKRGVALTEVPNMLSSQGEDLGTFSFEHFLQVAISDHSRHPRKPSEFENRQLLYSSPETLGLQQIDIDSNVERLADLGSLYSLWQDPDHTMSTVYEDTISESGRRLFTRLLHDPSSANGQDFSLRVQIEALQRVLALKGLWYDFSSPDTRLRLGQLLWSDPKAHHTACNTNYDLEPSEREVALLQITLAAELFMRANLANAALRQEQDKTVVFSVADRIAIEKSTTTKINWDLVLAERFLDNLEIGVEVPSRTTRNGFFGARSQLATTQEPEPFYRPKHLGRQIFGLLHFAETLHWPDTDRLEQDLLAKLMHATLGGIDNAGHEDEGVHQDPFQYGDLRRPRTRDSLIASDNKAQRYFGIPASSRSRRPSTAHHQKISRPTSSNCDPTRGVRLHAALSPAMTGFGLDIGGHLSRAWLTGFFMPGDAANHLLVSTLLENSPDALEVLGDVANFRGGFIYHERAYWSKDHVVGRVIAAAKGASECMGWISVPMIGLTTRHGWVEVEVESLPYCDPSSTRITDSEAVGKESDPLGNSEHVIVTEQDFVSAHDGLPVMGNEVLFRGLAFKQASVTGQGLTACMTFTSPVNRNLSRLDLDLLYDVSFVSSYPCFPQHASNSLLAAKPPSPSRPKLKPTSGEVYGDFFYSNFRDKVVSLSPKDSAHCSGPSSPGFIAANDVGKEASALAGHLLHVDYQYESVPVATLLTAAPGEIGVPNDGSEKVKVLDCRGTEELQLLARAWCANVGENALIAATTRTCLSCSIREAKALAMSVVIRI